MKKQITLAVALIAAAILSGCMSGGKPRSMSYTYGRPAEPQYLHPTPPPGAPTAQVVQVAPGTIAIVGPEVDVSKNRFHFPLTPKVTEREKTALVSRWDGTNWVVIDGASVYVEERTGKRWTRPETAPLPPVPITRK